MAEKSEKIKVATAIVSDVHISPRKVRLVTDSIRGKTLGQARTQLVFLGKKAAHPVLKLINSAAANASHNFQLDPERLIVKNIVVNQGRMMKRFKPRAQGRAFPIHKRSSMVQVWLEETGTSKKSASKRKPAKTPKEEQAPVEAAAIEQKPTAEKTQQKFAAPAIQKKPSRIMNIKRRLFNRKTNA